MKKYYYRFLAMILVLTFQGTLQPMPASATPTHIPLDHTILLREAAAGGEAGILIKPTSGLITDESGRTATFTIELTSRPENAVHIPLHSSDPSEGVIDVEEVSIGPGAWNQPQPVTIRGVDDNEYDGDVKYTIITSPAVGGGREYEGLNPEDVSVINLDNDYYPVVVNDDYSTPSDTILSVSAAEGVLANDTNPLGSPLTAALVGGPVYGSLDFHSDGSFVYTPDPTYTGDDIFTYRANNDEAESELATVTIHIFYDNETPFAADDSYATDQDLALIVSAPGVLANDSDPDGDPIQPVVVQEPTNGVLTLNSDGSFAYTPAVGFAGEDSFTYSAQDNSSLSEPALVKIQVNDTQAPTVEWGSSLVAEQRYDVGYEIFPLEVIASDNSALAKVRFYRWDSVVEDFIDIAILESPPYLYEFDTSSLNYGWNQIFAKAYDSSGNESQRTFIWLYQTIPPVQIPVQIFVPLIER